MTTQAAIAQTRLRSTLWADLVIICFCYAFAVLVLLHFLRPDYTPRSHMISDYAVGRLGWLMKSAFVAMSLGDVALALGLFRSGLRSAVARSASFLLVIVSIGLIISAIFPTDLEESLVSTRAGEIHAFSFLVNVGCSILVVILLPLAYRNHPDWRPFRMKSALLAALILLGFIIQFFTLHRGSPYGFANRAFVLILFVWTVATALHLRKVLLNGTSG